MPLAYHDQTPVGDKACGASCILCAAKELGVYPNPILDTDVDRVWSRIWRGDREEALTSRVARELGRLGLTAEIIENTGKTSGLLRSGSIRSPFEDPYEDFRADVENEIPWIRREDPAFTPADFDEYARLMLVVILPGSMLTHWLMARIFNNIIYVMNPDGGINTPHPTFVNWMNGPRIPKVIGGVPYFGFTGLVLSIKRTPQDYGTRR